MITTHCIMCEKNYLLLMKASDGPMKELEKIAQPMSNTFRFF